MGMEKLLADEILRLKRLLAEQESLNRVLHARLEEREREIERLLAQLDKLRRMYFGSQSEKLARRIAQTEAQLQILQQESDTFTGRVLLVNGFMACQELLVACLSRQLSVG